MAGNDEKSVEACLSQLHVNGWRVAIHNDYEQDGKLYTFWLLTNRDIGIFVKGEGASNESALAAAVQEANERVDFLRDIARRATAGRQLAGRVVAELKLATRWPCPECGREGPATPLRSLRIVACRPDREPTGPVRYTGCWRCNEGDRLVALAESVLTVPEG